MNASAWFGAALEAEDRAYLARSAHQRRRHGRDAVGALLIAASLGSHDACLQLGIYFQHGEFGILPVRLDLAEHWFRLAVGATDGTGMLALGTLLMETGRKPEGRKWLRSAVAHGVGGATCHLGRELEARSPARALKWYLKGVALGDPFAAVCAGLVLEARQTRRALLQAEAMYKKAARKHLQGADEDLERVRQKLYQTGLKRRTVK